jgi:hypothetical protein
MKLFVEMGYLKATDEFIKTFDATVFTHVHYTYAIVQLDTLDQLAYFYDYCKSMMERKHNYWGIVFDWYQTSIAEIIEWIETNVLLVKAKTDIIAELKECTHTLHLYIDYIE